jgi:hypothetical protein
MAVGDSARVALAAIRAVNGAAALLAPRLLARRLDVEYAAGPLSYPFRMFGIRTVLIAGDLLVRDPAVRRHALRAALVVHGSDTASAAYAGVKGELPRRAAVLTTAISATNLALAVVANRCSAAPDDQPVA